MANSLKSYIGQGQSHLYSALSTFTIVDGDPKMNADGLKKLASQTSEIELRRAMHELLRPFGGAREISVVMGEESGVHRCFVELNSEKHNLAVMDAFGGIDFGDVILILVSRSIAEAV